MTLQEYINNFSPSLPHMPLFHTCGIMSFEKILSDGRLSKSPCGVYKEMILYLFYGKPAYRIRFFDSTEILALLQPICVIIDPSEIDKITGILPFDSGAFYAGLYKGYFPTTMAISEFDIDPSVTDAAKYISAIFGSNEYYFEGRSADIDINAFCPSATVMKALCRKAYAEETKDDRDSSIEIRTNCEIKMNNNKNIKAVIMPRSYAQYEFVKTWLRNNDHIILLTYPSNDATNPNECHQRIMQAAWNFIAFDETRNNG